MNGFILKMTQIDQLRIYFVLPTDDIEMGFSPDMKLCSQMVTKYGGYVECMKPSDCLAHEPLEKDVFVFEKFEGNAFETLNRNSSKFVILGVRCLLTCIISGRPIPPNPHPVFTEGMRNLWITTSGFDAATKKQIQEKVQFMSGNYDNTLRSIITHLVAHNNISKKAMYAYSNNIKIMKLSWIEAVWEKSLVNNVTGEDQVFNKYISPFFHNLNITTSGIPKLEKENLKKTIENFGGTFTGTLQGNVTHVVLLNKAEGEKYKHAKSWNIPCVKPNWVYDCIEAQRVLPFKNYVVEGCKPKASTPNKENSTVNFSANFTANLSVINLESRVLTHVDETAATQNTQFARTQENGKSHLNLINNTLLKNIKDAGLFLDGLNIYLHGFHPEETEKLKRVLNKAGAVRFNEMSESVTHVIAAKKDDKVSNLRKHGAYVLSIDWLVESMKLKCKASENKFLLVSNSPSATEPPSPMSKQGAQLLSQTEPRVPQFSLEDNNVKLSEIDELLCRYNASQPGEPLDRPEEPSATNKSDLSKTYNHTSDEFFMGLTFFLSSDLSEEEVKYLEDLIKERKGQIVGKRDLGVPDFAIVPVIGATLTEVTAKEVVNVYFIKDCCIENCLLSPRYYHQPVAFVKNARPLKNCVISVSNYVQGEREFMEMMIEALGGIAQSLLARKPKQGALKSTHLVCAEAQGQKYEGAVRWGLPVVHHDWLLKCAALGVKVSEKPYLVGDSKMPPEVMLQPTSSISEMEMERPPEPTEPPKPTRPVHNAITRLKATETPKTNSPDPNRTVTPTSPYGAFYGKGSPTPGTRKRIWKWMNQGADFPLDPPSKQLQEEESTPVSELISRHLEMLKRKPEELPPDSPIASKRLNMDEAEEEEQAASVANGLERMRQIEKKMAKNGMKSSPVKKTETPEAQKMLIFTESQPHTEVGWEDPAEKEVALKTLTKVATNKPKVFIFSCISDQTEVKQVVENCGGVVSPLPHFDKNATHVIAGSLTRAEKLLAGIAAGLWILHPSYLDALKEHKNVYDVAEEDYEWGSPKQIFRLNSVSSNAKEFAGCAHAWRIAIENGTPPPFKNIKMVLHLSAAKMESFERVIKAGGGIIIRGLPPHYHEVDADLCVYEANNTGPINFSSLAKQRIRCVALVYVSDAILKKNDAIDKNLIPEFLKYWNK